MQADIWTKVIGATLMVAAGTTAGRLWLSRNTTLGAVGGPVPADNAGLLLSAAAGAGLAVRHAETLETLTLCPR